MLALSNKGGRKRLDKVAEAVGMLKGSLPEDALVEPVEIGDNKRRLVMNRLSVDLENCYGIKQCKYDFDFTAERVYALYAPNGAMKSSLAQTFKDISNGLPSKDRIFPDRVSRRSVVDEAGQEIAQESVFVVRPYDEEFAHTENTSILLVNSKLRKEYEQLNDRIDRAKAALLKALKSQSQSKRDLENEISLAFTSAPGKFKIALTRIRKELSDQKNAPFTDVIYDKIFDDRVLAFLETKDAKTAIEGYVRRYNELLAASIYFKKGIFDYYNAGQIAKSLADNGFFAAKHTINLNAETKLEIKTEKELENVITQEKAAILKDQTLAKQFDSLGKSLAKNVMLRDFRKYMQDHETLLAELANVDEFRQNIFKSNLKVHYDLYQNLMNEYDSAEARAAEIEAEAARERTQWEDVIKIFNSRFIVPFKLEVENRTAVILGEEKVITLGFTYRDGNEERAIDKDALLQVLSTGEKKAFYVLNIIFEVETRKKERRETLMVIDDIADSFDYQNKYAIVQYLKDISDDPLFKQIIMTHNFDFFRTINLRFVRYSYCLMATRTADGVSIRQAAGIRNVFVNDWKKHFFDDPKKKVASIPFMRNLIEWTKGEGDPAFVKLTSLLHWKQDSPGITEAQLDGIYNQLFTQSETGGNGARPVVDLIHEQARQCMTNGSDFALENKIVLAVAIRLGAEQYMVERIDDLTITGDVKSNQTSFLFDKFKETFSMDTETIEILGRVVLMTPENIHLNSFMYEPIVDMSDEHLRRLYGDVQRLNGSIRPT